MKAVALIPARGGSKRLPRKNVLPVAGNPMIAYPIRTALESGLFEHVVVSTEDVEIARVAREYGAEVHDRSLELAGDEVGVDGVCTNFLSEWVGQSPDAFCCIYATAIFVEASDLVKSMAVLEGDDQPGFVMGVSEYPYHPVQALTEKNGFLEMQWPEWAGKQSQEYPRYVVSNGTLYWAKWEAFLRTGTFYGEGLKGYLMPRARAVDIDTPEDYEEALERMALRTK